MLKGLYIFVLLSFNYSLFAQEFQLLYPKSGQVYGEDVEVKLSKPDFDDVSYRFVLDSGLIRILDTISQRESLVLELSTGVYNVQSFLIQNSNSIDSTDRVSFRVFSPLELDSLELWLIADLADTNTQGGVDTWIDLSDSAHVLQQSDPNRQPSKKLNALNGYGSLQFTFPEAFTTTSVNMDKDNFTISAVYAHTGSINKNSRLIYGSSNWFMGSFGGNHLVFDGVNILNSGATEIGRYVSHSAYSKEDSLFTFLNGELRDSSLDGPSPQNIWISRIAGDNFEGEVSEIVMYEGRISIGERSLLDRYLMDKYAPPISLGGDKVLCSFPDTLHSFKDYLRSYNWSTGDTTSFTVIDSAGVYYLDAIDEFGRITTDTIEYFLDTSNAFPSFTFSDTTICQGEQIDISVGPDRFSYQWNDATTANSITIDSAGLYKVTITNCASNSLVDSFTVHVNQPLFDLGVDTNICFNSNLQLTPDSAFLNVEYSWSTGDTSNFVFTDSSGLYRLTITDAFGCQFSDSIRVLSDSSLLGFSLGPDTSLCEGNSIALDGNVPGPPNYLWGTGNTSPTQIVDTSGTYTLTFSDSICTISDSIQVTIQGLAPSADFSLANLCLSDSVSFIDGSTAPVGDTLVSFVWDFAGLASDTNQNVFYSFPDTGNFSVELKVTTDKGCEDTASRMVDIKPLPEVDFLVSGKCARRPLQFTNNSSIAEGSLQDFSWTFGDGFQSNQQSPTKSYDSSGNYLVKLVVSSNEGCSDSLSQQLRVNPTPLNTYQLFGSCQGDSSRLVSTSSLDSGKIINYTWLLNQQVIEDSIANILFLSAGRKTLVLRTESDSGCVAILRDTIDIFNSPVANFEAPDPCEGDSLLITDNSFGQGDTITNYFYRIVNAQGSQTSTLQNPSFLLEEKGVYQLTQLISTSNGCQDSLSRSVVLNSKPIADFQVLNNGSGAPMQLEVSNDSQLADTFQWSSGNGQSSSLETPVFTYSDTGSYSLQLVAVSDADCRDTLTQSLFVLPGFLDAAIVDAQIFPGLTNDFRIRLRLENQGNNQINEMLISVLPEGSDGLAEALDLNLYRGESFSQLLNSILLDSEPQPSFICFEIEAVNGVKDENPMNDRFCISAFPEQLYLKAYPNPFQDRLEVEFVLMESSTIDITLVDASGRSVLTISEDQFFGAGYHQLNASTAELSSGVYLLRFRIAGNLNEIKLIKP